VGVFQGLLLAMARSVVLEGTRRCDRCRLAPRWCICAADQAIVCPLAIDVLMHHREYHRPTSTGRLINRVIPASRNHLFRREIPPSREAIMRPGHALWILHPRGEPLPENADPAGVQLLLLDGSWREAARMTQAVSSWGRLYRLPPAGGSRFGLRVQHHEDKYSTVESLQFILLALGLLPAAEQLRLQFELHVYAGLRARGAKAAAAQFLADSPIREAFPALLRQLDERQSNA
jgi:DTW domain-containing protein YfiP